MIFSTFRSPAITLLIAAAVVIVGIWGFVEIADEVQEGEPLSFDEQVVHWTRRAENPSMLIGPKPLHRIGRDITALGSYPVLVLVVIAMGSFLCLQRRCAAAVWILAATAGGALLNSILKSVFNRGRPDLPPTVYVTSSSFPSGHAMISAAVYLTLGLLVAGMTGERRLKIHCLLTAMLITLLVGASRVYLGVHYLTDVLAGWLTGSVWAMVCYLSFRFLENRGS